LEAIGAVPASEGKKALLRGGNYQECVTTPLTQVADNLAALQDEDDGIEDENEDILASNRILISVEKVNKLNLFSLLVLVMSSYMHFFTATKNHSLNSLKSSTKAIVA
jgi:hypothetical protein